MTTYRLNLTSDEGDTTPGRILATLVTEDGATMAATLRAVADQLDLPRPAYRRAADQVMIDIDISDRPPRGQNVIYRRNPGGVPGSPRTDAGRSTRSPAHVR